MSSVPAPEPLRDSAVPKHEQLRHILRRVATEQLAPGALVPSERALMLDYGVSRITVREAIGQLVNDGVLVRVRGKGTFVANRTVRSRLHLASFTEEMRAQGYEPTTVVLESGIDVPPPAAAQALGLADGIDAVHVKRLRLADGRPVSVDDAWYDRAQTPGLLELDLTASVYRALADRFGRPIDRAEQTVGADPASAEIAALLGIAAGAPVLHFERVSFSGTQTIEHAQSWYRSDRYRLQMEVRG